MELDLEDERSEDDTDEYEGGENFGADDDEDE